MQLIKLHAHLFPRKHQHTEGNVRMIVAFYSDIPLSQAYLFSLPCNTRCMLIWDRYKVKQEVSSVLRRTATANNAINVVL